MFFLIKSSLILHWLSTHALTFCHTGQATSLFLDVFIPSPPMQEGQDQDLFSWYGLLAQWTRSQAADSVIGFAEKPGLTHDLYNTKFNHPHSGRRPHFLPCPRPHPAQPGPPHPRIALCYLPNPHRLRHTAWGLPWGLRFLVSSTPNLGSLGAQLYSTIKNPLGWERWLGQISVSNQETVRKC